MKLSVAKLTSILTTLSGSSLRQLRLGRFGEKSLFAFQLPLPRKLAVSLLGLFGVGKLPIVSTRQLPTETAGAGFSSS